MEGGEILMDQNKSCSCGSCKCEMDCCMEHKMSKEHLEAKKQRLEEKLAKVNEDLGKASE